MRPQGRHVPFERMRRVSSRTLPLAACCMVVLVAPPDASARQTIECDSVLVRLREEDDPQGYRRRPAPVGGVDRCEGTFRPEVLGDNLWVAGFFEAFAEFPTDSVVPLEANWVSPDSVPTYLTVHSVRIDQPYRMDVLVPAEQPAFQWSTGVILPLSLRRADLRPLAFSFDPSRGALHLPLRIGSTGDVPGSDWYILTVVPTSRLSDVRVSIARVDSVGAVPGGDAYLVYDRSIDQGRLFITRTPIDIAIEKPEEPGIYVVEVQGLRAGAEPLPTLPVWFYHPGP